MAPIAKTPASDQTIGQPANNGASLETLQNLLAEDLQQVNATLLKLLKSEVELIPVVSQHLVAAGGKRLRPLLCLAAAHLCNYDDKNHVKLAAIVELIHTATLLHDDVVDNSTLRRGRQTANDVWDNKASVLVGDFLFSRAFELMVDLGSLPILRVLSNASSTIAEGEVLQLATHRNLETSQEDYFRVVESKTAALFAAATQTGAMIAEAPAEDCNRLRAFGQAFGIAYQLVDDVLDYSPEAVNLGKKIGDDMCEGKVTLPIILAWKQADEETRAFLTTMYSEEAAQTSCNDENLHRVIDILRDSGALEKCRGLAVEHAVVAQDLLSHFPDSPVRKALADAITFCTTRLA